MQQEKINYFDILPDELLEPIVVFCEALSQYVLFHVSQRFQNFVSVYIQFISDSYFCIHKNINCCNHFSLVINIVALIFNK